MYEYAVDKNSGQYKAPFNQINNEARVFTYKDTAIVTPNSDTPYSMLWMDLRAEPMVLSVPAVEKIALLLGAALRRQHLQLRLHRQPRHRTATPAITWWPGPTGKAKTPPGIKKVFHSTTPFSVAIFRTQLFNAGRYAECGQGPGRLQSAAAFGILKQPAPPAAPDSISPRSTRNS